MKHLSSFWKSSSESPPAKSFSTFLKQAQDKCTAFAKDTSEALTEASQSFSAASASWGGDISKGVQAGFNKIEAEYKNTFSSDTNIRYIQSDIGVIHFPHNSCIDAIAKRLEENHEDNYLVINMSERGYDTEKFRGDVVDVNFRSLPAPPIQVMAELCISVQSWLSSDPRNVVIVHCYQGFTRTAIFLSCFLAWSSLARNPVDALRTVCEKLRVDEQRSILPSQRRYLSYFQQTMEGFTPPGNTVIMTRLILNGVPNFSTVGGHDDCIFRPYIEVWQHGNIVYTSLGEDEEAPPGYVAADASIAFDLKLTLKGDALVRVRHYHLKEQRESVLRAAFNTSFLQDGFLHLGKAQLDGANLDDRVHVDCFINMVFQPHPEDVEDPNNELFDRFRQMAKELKQKARENAPEGSESEDEMEELRQRLGESNFPIDLSPDEVYDMDDQFWLAGNVPNDKEEIQKIREDVAANECIPDNAGFSLVTPPQTPRKVAEEGLVTEAQLGSDSSQSSMVVVEQAKSLNSSSASPNPSPPPEPTDLDFDSFLTDLDKIAPSTATHTQPTGDTENFDDFLASLDNIAK